MREIQYPSRFIQVDGSDVIFVESNNKGTLWEITFKDSVGSVITLQMSGETFTHFRNKILKKWNSSEKLTKLSNGR